MKTFYKITMATIAAVAMTFAFSETSAQNSRSGYRGGSSSNSSSVSRSGSSGNRSNSSTVSRSGNSNASRSNSTVSRSGNSNASRSNSTVSRSNNSGVSTSKQNSTVRSSVTDGKRETSSALNNRGNINSNRNSTPSKSNGTVSRPTGNSGAGSRPTGGSNTGSNVRPDDNGNRPGSGAGTRPNGGSGSGTNVRPDDNGSRPGGGTRPDGGSNSGTNVRPGNNGNRPGSGAGTRPNEMRPGNSHPGHDNHYNDHYYHDGCGNPNHHLYPTPPPHRPLRPVAHCCHRPVFPTNYRPYAYAPTISAIFGLRFGFSMGYSIEILANNGYVIDGYTGNEIYLRNVRNSGYQWDDAIIYYDDYGNMAGVSFYDSTTRYSTRRYDAVYAHLCNIYGRPAIINNYGGSLSASWWDGSGSSYITLSLASGNAFGGTSRFYTTLSFGNNY